MWSLDFWLGVLILAAVPLWMAAYGAHVAAEAISEDRKRLRVRLRFWAVGLLGLIVAMAYQYRTQRNEDAKQKSMSSWQSGVSDKLEKIINQPPSPQQKQDAVKLKNEVARGPKIAQTLHPIIQVMTTSVSYDAATREVIVKLSFMNLSSSEVEAKLHMHLLWGGPHFPTEMDMPKETSFDRIVAMGPQPYNFVVSTSYTLPPDQASQWVGEKALIMVGAAATYADRDAATEYDFAGSVRLKQNFVDVDMSRWFPRPKSAAAF